MPDDEILQTVRREIIKNNDIIKTNTDANYKLALGMEDLGDKVAQQALISKLQADQEELLTQAIGGNEDVNKEKVQQSAFNMAEDLVKLNSDELSKMVATQEVSVGQIISTALNPFDGIVDAMADSEKGF